MNLFELATEGEGLYPSQEREAPGRLPGFEPPSNAPAPSAYRPRIRPDIDAAITQAAADYSVDEGILRGLLHVESRFDPEAVSPAGAIGIAQIMPGTAKRFDIDPRNPIQSVFAGAAYVRANLDKFDQDYDRALAGYNTGENLSLYKSKDWFRRVKPEVLKYVKDIYTYADQFDQERGKGRALPPEVKPSTGYRTAAPNDPRRLDGPDGGKQYLDAVWNQTTPEELAAAEKPFIGMQVLPSAKGPAPAGGDAIMDALGDRRNQQRASNIVRLNEDLAALEQAGKGKSPQANEVRSSIKRLTAELGDAAPRYLEQANPATAQPDQEWVSDGEPLHKKLGIPEHMVSRALEDAKGRAQKYLAANPTETERAQQMFQVLAMGNLGDAVLQHKLDTRNDFVSASDIPAIIAKGGSDLLTGAGELFGLDWAKRYGKAADKWLRSTFTPETVNALNNELNFNAQAQTAVPGSIVGTGVGLGVGGVFSKIIGSALNATNAGRAAILATEMSAAAGDKAPLLARALTAAPTNLGAALGEGAASGLGAAAQAGEEFDNVPLDKLRATPRFRELMQAQTGSVEEAAKKTQALLRDEYIRKSSGLTAAATAGLAAAIPGIDARVLRVITAPVSMLEKEGVESAVKRLGATVAKETGQEFPQGYGEKVGENLAAQQTIDPQRELTEGALTNASLSGIGGWGMAVGGHVAAEGVRKVRAPRVEDMPTVPVAPIVPPKAPETNAPGETPGSKAPPEGPAAPPAAPPGPAGPTPQAPTGGAPGPVPAVAAPADPAQQAALDIERRQAAEAGAESLPAAQGAPNAAATPVPSDDPTGQPRDAALAANPAPSGDVLAAPDGGVRPAGTADGAGVVGRAGPYLPGMGGERDAWRAFVAPPAEGGLTAGTNPVGGLRDAAGKLAQQAPATALLSQRMAIKRALGVDFAPTSKPLNESQRFASMLARAMGKTLTVVEKTSGPDDTLLPNGSINKVGGEHIFIDANADDSALFVAVHEGLHGLPAESRAALEKGLLALFKADMRGKFAQEFNYDEASLDAEIPAMMAQALSKRADFWSELRGHLGNHDFAQVAKHILSRLNDLVRGIKDNYGEKFLQRYVGEAEKIIAARDLLARAYADAIANRPAGAGQTGAKKGQSSDANATDTVRYSNARRDGGLSPDAGPDGRGAASNGRDRPSYGQPRPGAVSVVGVHYSSAARTSLNGARYGTGLRGAEAKRLAGADPQLRNRIYFYVDLGQGIRPEAGVGSIAHEVRLDNLYDPASGLLPAAEGNAFEMSVIQAGFDGYYVKDFTTTQGAAVLLGDRHRSVPVAPAAPNSQAAAPAAEPKRLTKALLSRERNAVQLGNIPGARITSTSSLEIPADQREAANAEMERIGSPARYSQRSATPARKRLDVSLSASTSTIPGLALLQQRATRGDTAAHKLLQDLAHDALRTLLGDAATVRSTGATGLYAGQVESSVALRVAFDEASQAAVLAALAKFAENFNQEQVHVRQRTTDAAGTQYPDGSYATPIYRWQIDQPLSRKQVQDVIDKSGLYGLTFGDDFVEAYYVGNPTDTAAIDDFRVGAGRATAVLGTRVKSLSSGNARLWPYGSGRDDGTIGFDRIRGSVPAGAKADAKAARLVAQYLNQGAKVKTFKQTPTVTAKQRALQAEIGAAYEALPDNDLYRSDTRRAYTALRREVERQFETLPIKVEVLTGQGEPYAGSDDMRQDVRENNHLFIFGTTPDTFGPPGEDFSGHPLLEPTRFKDVNDVPLLANDLLRAVHDYYAHTMSPTQFGPKGEEAAWKNHMAMTPDPWARWALTSETRGQNSWVNFRPELDQSTPARDRPFARQKAALLPLRYVLTGEAAVDKPVADLMAELSAVAREGTPPQPVASNRRVDLNTDVTVSIPVEGGKTATLTVNAKTMLDQLAARQRALEMVKECLA